jgi:hypothetical protein
MASQGQNVQTGGVGAERQPCSIILEQGLTALAMYAWIRNDDN